MTRTHDNLFTKIIYKDQRDNSLWIKDYEENKTVYLVSRYGDRDRIEERIEFITWCDAV